MGVAGSVHFPWEIIFLVTSIFPLGYKIEKKNSQLARFCNMKFTCNKCVWSTVIIFTLKNIPLEKLLLSNGKCWFPITWYSKS